MQFKILVTINGIMDMNVGLKIQMNYQRTAMKYGYVEITEVSVDTAGIRAVIS